MPSTGDCSCPIQGLDTDLEALFLIRLIVEI